MLGPESTIPKMNQYLLTRRDQWGEISQCGVTAPSMRLAIDENHHPFELIKIERLDPETGVVLGGLYYE